MADEKHNESGGEESHGSLHSGPSHAGGAHEEHEGAPEWLISFADNTALMMGFFVILLAMNMKAPVAHSGIGSQDKNSGPSPSELDFVIALRDAFNPIDLASDNPAEAALRKRIRERMAEGNWRSRQPEDHGESRESQAIRPTDLSNLGGSVPFDDDSDFLNPKAQARAEEIASRIKGQRFYVEIRGHTSPSETFRNHDKAIALSYERAKAVGDSLAAHGVPWDQIRIVLCGDNERNVDRSYDENDRLNQRADVVVTGDRLPDRIVIPVPAPRIPAPPESPRQAPANPAPPANSPRG